MTRLLAALSWYGSYDSDFLLILAFFFDNQVSIYLNPCRPKSILAKEQRLIDKKYFIAIFLCLINICLKTLLMHLIVFTCLLRTIFFFILLLLYSAISYSSLILLFLKNSTSTTSLKMSFFLFLLSKITKSTPPANNLKGKN